MPLSEPQIARYSRQILLKAVGGGGQEKLLGSAVHVRGHGRALMTACAYLAASGVPLALEEEATREDAGFLFGEDARGLSSEETLAHFNPDAVAKAPLRGILAGGTLEANPELHRVALQDGGLVFAAAGAGALPGADGSGTPSAVLLGSLAAWTMQRLILEIGPRRGVVHFDEDGAFSLEACP